VGAETWISVDIETSGPSPSTGSLLSVGACLVQDEAQGIELLLRPDPALPWTDEAQRIHGLDRATLERDGIDPADAIARLEAWVLAVTPEGGRPVFVGLNAPFDWMFVADACWRNLGRNPFGPSALDIKSLFLGVHLPEVATWTETSRLRMLERHPVKLPHTHTALADAQEQAVLCRRIVEAATAARRRP
jgi:ribonuclease T